MYVLIPKTCTDRLQPMDLSVNKPFKDRLKQSFQTWYASQIQQQVKQKPDSASLSPVDVCLTIMKPLHAQWLIEAFRCIESNPETITNGFKAAGILDKLNSCTITV